MSKKTYRKTFRYEGIRYDITASSEKALIEKVILKKKALEEGSLTVNGTMLTKDWIVRYLDTYKEPSLKSDNYRDLKNRINKNITSKIGNMQIKAVKSSHCQKILNDISHLSSSHIKKIHQSLVDIFEKAIDNDMIIKNPAGRLTRPKGYTNSRRSITEYERETILKVAEVHKHGLWVLSMLYLGLRPSETAYIQGKHIDRQNMTIYIPGTKSENADRLVPIPAPFFVKLPKLKPFDYLFPTKNGGQGTRNSRRRAWESFERYMNIEMGCKTFRGKVLPPYAVAPDLTPYCLRHTFCTDLQAAGVPINVAKELMGHSDISLTAKIYTHKSKEAFENAAKLINEFQNTKTL